MRTRLLLLTLLITASCVPTARPVPPRPVARPLPAPAPPPVASADWRDWPVTPGRWTYTRDERGSVAMFGTTGADAAAVLRCDRAGQRVFLSRAGAMAAPFVIRTSSVARTVPAGAAGSEPPYVATPFAPADPLLDAMAFSRGRFAIEQAGAAPLVLPAWAEVGRVIEDCRP